MDIVAEEAGATLPAYADFAAALGEHFDLVAGEAMVRLTLTEATATGPSPLDPARETFSLLFRDTTQRVLPQGTWRMRNATLGELDIFLVPVARDKDGTSYEAVFG